MRHRLLFALISSLCIQGGFSQKPPKPSSTDIYHQIQKLNFLGTALYVAAHPDDENTRLISYLSNKVGARTGYLSITRGDGGQNLIGSEIQELLGVMRTQELLDARRVDGCEQRFTRANDFGYSKHPDETLSIWNREEVLSDVVWAIRTFKPDVIINRFDHKKSTWGRTHGHHTASAVLSLEAFDLAADATRFTDQLKYTETWQPKRLFFNTSWWFYGSRENFAKADKSAMLKMNVGVYYPWKGLSNTEIAALSRSQHKCQGFGSTGSRGDLEEYIELIKGAPPEDKDNLFDGINTTWTRVKGGKAIGTLLEEVQKDFDFTNPSASVPKLVSAYQRISLLENPYWRIQKSEEIKNIIAACTGLYLECRATESSAVPGETVSLQLEATNRSDLDISLIEVAITHGGTLKKGLALRDNQRNTFGSSAKLPEYIDYTAPYWLKEKGSLGMYHVKDQTLIGNPETPRALVASFVLSVEGVTIPFERNVVYKYNDPANGEVYRPFEILPPITMGIANKVTIFADAYTKEVPVTVMAGTSNISGRVSLSHPEGWQVQPEYIDFSIAQKGDQQTVAFNVTPPNSQSEGYLYPCAEIGEILFKKELVKIDHEHIPLQSVLLPSQAKVVRLDILKSGENIGYIVGAGDEVPESLRQIGYQVFTIDPETIAEEDLSKYDAIVVGIRAYNTIDALKFKQKYLLDYVNNGGTMVVQYNTSRRVKVDNIAPYNLALSRDRVTEEDAKVQVIARDHALVNFPNPITEEDFEGWVQERGLYFPNSWGKEFTPILSTHDKGQAPTEGSLLIAKYGNGYYIYTGLSFFRELPAGVPGAYKLFANMLSVGKAQVQSGERIKG